MECENCERDIYKETVYTYTWHKRNLSMCEECFLWAWWVRNYDRAKMRRFFDNIEVTWVWPTTGHEYSMYMVREEAIIDVYESMLREDEQIKADAIEDFLHNE